MVFLIAIIQALPIAFVALLFRKKAPVIITTLAMIIIAIATGSIHFILVDLIFIAGTYWVFANVQQTAIIKSPLPSFHSSAAFPLIFKNNIVAFEYACKFFDNTLIAEKAIVGIIIDRNKEGDYCLKVANDKNSSIPRADQVMSWKRDDRYHGLYFTIPKKNCVPEIDRGDLVSFVPYMEVRNGKMNGYVSAKLKAEIDSRSGYFISIDD